MEDVMLKPSWDWWEVISVWHQHKSTLMIWTSAWHLQWVITECWRQQGVFLWLGFHRRFNKDFVRRASALWYQPSIRLYHRNIMWSRPAGSSDRLVSCNETGDSVSACLHSVTSQTLVRLLLKHNCHSEPSVLIFKLSETNFLQILTQMSTWTEINWVEFDGQKFTVTSQNTFLATTLDFIYL